MRATEKLVELGFGIRKLTRRVYDIRNDGTIRSY